MTTTTVRDPTNRDDTAHRTVATPAISLLNIVQELMLWHARANARRHLRELSSVMLRDIGITRAEVLREARKFPWQP